MAAHEVMVKGGKMQTAWSGRLADGRYSILVAGCTGMGLWESTYSWPMTPMERAEFEWAITQHGCDRGLLRAVVKDAVKRFPPKPTPKQETLKQETLS